MISINYPKKAQNTLIKRAQKAIKQIQEGTATLRKTIAYGYFTMDIGDGNRLVVTDLPVNEAHVFNSHKQYERFIAQRH